MLKESSGLEDPGKEIHQDSASRFLEMIILITSLVPTHVKEAVLALNMAVILIKKDQLTL